MTSIRRNQPMITQEQADITPGAHLADFGACGLYNDGVVYVAMMNRGHPGTMGGHFSYKFNVDGPEIERWQLIWGSTASTSMRQASALTVR
jgi:hypothetical protein